MKIRAILLIILGVSPFGIFAQVNQQPPTSTQQIPTTVPPLNYPTSPPQNGVNIPYKNSNNPKVIYQQSNVDYTDNLYTNSIYGGDSADGMFIDSVDVVQSNTSNGSVKNRINQGPNSIYGQSYLDNINSDFTSYSNFVPPPNYRIGPGDLIAVNIWDGSEQQQTYEVSKDGSIYAYGLGKIYVQGLTFENLQSMLRARFYSIVSSSSKVDVQLVKVRAIKVNVVGEVESPNSYVISSFATVLNVLAEAGGVTNLGSMRNIEIKRNGYTIYTLDLYDFIENGGQINENMYLENNDYIVVPIHKKTVKATGDFRRPMYYQLKDNENLQSLLELTGGVKPTARLSSADLYRIGNDQVELLNIPIVNYLDDPNMDFILNDGDDIQIFQQHSDIVNTVYITGAVMYPGNYELLEGETLYDLISKSGGLTKNAYLKRAIVRHSDTLNPSNIVNIDLENFSMQSPYNVKLNYGDVVTIFSKSAYSRKRYVKILGEIRSPGTYNYSGQMTVKDLILMAGGLNLRAEYSKVEISRVYDTIGPMGYVRTQPNKVYELKITPNLEEDQNTSNFYLKPYDIVAIKTSHDFKLQQVVYIGGEVKNPGPYTLTDSLQTITDLISEAGGLTPLAKIENSRMNRDSLGEFYCDFVKAVNRPHSKWDHHLYNNDVIYIPKDNNIVEVKGMVVNPTSTFVNPNFTSVMDYIDISGGYSLEADKDHMVIHYNDGRTVRPKKVWFFRFYPRLTDGATIVVPKERKTIVSEYERRAVDEAWQRVGQLTATISSMATSLISAVILYNTVSK